MERKEPKKRDTSFPAALAVLVFLGGLIRLVNLGNIIFYWDEPLHCVRIAAQSLRWTLAHNDGSAFFALLVHLLLPLGKLEWMARLPSFLAGILVIPAVYYLGKELLGRRAGLLAAAFTTFSPLLIQYSQYSRMYATYILFSTLSLYFFDRAITKDTTRDWAGYAIFTVLLIYNHLFGLFLIPVFGFFAAYVWMREGLAGRKIQPKPFRLKKIIHFKVWTILAFLVTAVLYIPDTNMHQYVKAVFSRAAAQPKDSPVTFFFMDHILSAQLKATSPAFFILFVGLILVGLVFTFSKRPRTAVLACFTIFIPYFAFILIKPTEATFLSAFRYFLFYMPFFFLFMAEALLWLAGLLAVLLRRLKLLAARTAFSTALPQILAWAAVAVLILGGFNLKAYYTEYWRLGTLRIAPEVTEFLEQTVKKDAFIYFEDELTASRVMCINPLTKDLVYDEVQFIIRKRMKAPAGKIPMMLYRIPPNLLKFYAPMKTDLWVVLPGTPEKASAIRPLLNSQDGTQVFPLKHHIVLSFQNPGQPLHAKLIQATDFLEKADFQGRLNQEHAYLQARNYLLAGDFAPAVRYLEMALKTKPSPAASYGEKPSFLFRGLDALFSLDAHKLREINQKRYREAISHLLLFFGDALRKDGDFDSALKAYTYCVALSATYRTHVTIRIKNLANTLFRKGKIREAVPFYQKILDLAPKSGVPRWMLAEALRKSGDLEAADTDYREALQRPEISRRFIRLLGETDPLLLVWKDGSQWHFLFRSQSPCHFEGKIATGRKFRRLSRSGLGQQDVLKSSDGNLHFQIHSNKGIIKLFAFEVPEGTSLDVRVRMNKLRRAGNILLVDSESHPAHIPFSLR